MINSRIIPGMYFAISLYGLYQVVSFFQLSPMYIGGLIFLPVAAFCFFSAMVYAPLRKRAYTFHFAGLVSLLIVVGFIAWNMSTMLGIGYTSLNGLMLLLTAWRLRRYRTKADEN